VVEVEQLGLEVVWVGAVQPIASDVLFHSMAGLPGEDLRDHGVDWPLLRQLVAPEPEVPLRDPNGDLAEEGGREGHG
jgi:hypothetical protein